MLERIKKAFILGLILAVVFGGSVVYLGTAPLKLSSQQVDFHVARGSSMRAAANEIAGAGVGIRPWLLIGLGKAFRVETSIKAGSYTVDRGITTLGLLNKLTRGDVTQTEIVFVEGWTFSQMRERIDAHPDLLHESKGLSDAAVLRLIGAQEKTAEGLFFPDTYLFSKHSKDVDVLARAYRNMQRHLSREWEARAAGLPYGDAYQALIMASIIEKETGQDQDRPLIAAVFVNRLRQGMLLQTDPTVIFGVGDKFVGSLRKRDLLTDTPYNTYTRSGLPPSPISMPGLASLQAALHPAQSQALYFVARGDGSSEFSETLAEHNRAVSRYQRNGK